MLKNIIREEVKKFIKSKNILNETLTDIVYHFTYVTRINNILEKNEFNLAPVFGSGYERKINKGKLFFLSTTRSKSSGYKGGDVKIVLNGRTLNSNYKSVPINYWGYSTNPNDYSNRESYLQSLSSNEQEDRIFSNKSVIPNAINYILEIHIYLHKIYIENHMGTVSNIINICKQNKIPLYFYDNKKNWLMQTKPIEPPNVENIEYQKKEERSRFEYDLASLIAFNDEDNYNAIINFLGDENSIKRFNDELKERTYNNFRIGATYLDDSIASISATIHNMKTNTDKSSKFLINLLAKDLLKYKTNSLKEYLKIKQFKGRKTIDDYKKDLYDYLINIIDSEYRNELENRFDRWIEIDGQYFDKESDSPIFMKYFNQYVDEIKKYIKNTIFSKDSNIFENYFELDKDRIKANINLNFDNPNITNKINITDSYYDSRYGTNDGFNDDIKSTLDYILYAIDNNYFSKAKELYDEYQKNIYSSSSYNTFITSQP